MTSLIQGSYSGINEKIKLNKAGRETNKAEISKVYDESKKLADLFSITLEDVIK